MSAESFASLIEAVKKCSEEEKRSLFETLRSEFTLHPLEKKFGVRAEVICEAIARASDLTQRGIRGVIAEAIFVQQVLPRDLKTGPWREVADFSATDVPYDCVVAKDRMEVRVQVKNQRSERGVPKEAKGCWVVEVQKTRSGKRDGEDTRPYRFTDFDMIAVCTWPSTGDWTRFAYCLTADLQSRADDKSLIEIMQRIPKDGNSGVWSTNLVAKLDELAARKA